MLTDLSYTNDCPKESGFVAKRKQQQATMNDVAALAGVSQATVSLVLNSLGTDRFNDRFTEATQVRVMNAVEKLGYGQ